jgi:hypothetical protein
LWKSGKIKTKYKTKQLRSLIIKGVLLGGERKRKRRERRRGIRKSNRGD